MHMGALGHRDDTERRLERTRHEGVGGHAARVSPPTPAVITVTPVAKRPMTRRKCAGSISRSGACRFILAFPALSTGAARPWSNLARRDRLGPGGVCDHRRPSVPRQSFRGPSRAGINLPSGAGVNAYIGWSGRDAAGSGPRPRAAGDGRGVGQGADNLLPPFVGRQRTRTAPAMPIWTVFGPSPINRRSPGAEGATERRCPGSSVGRAAD